MSENIPATTESSGWSSSFDVHDAAQREILEYKRTKGFLMVADAGHKAIESVARLHVPRLSDPEPPEDVLRIGKDSLQVVAADLQEYTPRPSVAGVAYMTRVLYQNVSDHVDSSDKAKFNERFGVDPERRREAAGKFNFQEGLAEQEFTWHFAPAVAVDVIEHFRHAGLITEEQLDSLALSDYADMFAAPWFHNLMHDLALTGNGRYSNYGERFKHYQYNSLGKQMNYSKELSKANEIYALGEWTDEKDGRTYYTASLTKEFRKSLRDYMHATDSNGCPVARRTGMLALELANDDKHLKGLVDGGYMEVTYAQDSDKVRYSYKYTAISHALDTLAQQFRDYDERYGTPQLHVVRPVDAVEVFVQHEQRAKTNALSYESSEDES